jgi:acyl-CoA synthetase (AMP-forming)/AMP-acid ligase II
MASPAGDAEHAADRAGPAGVPATVPALVRDAAARHADVEAVVDGDARVTYAKLGRLVDAAARAHLAAGVEPGDRVALWAPNGLDWVVAALGAQAAGAVLVPLSTRLKGTEAAYVLGRSRARVLVVVGDFLGTRYPAMLDGRDLPDLRAVAVLDGPEGGADAVVAAAARPGTTTWPAFLAAGATVDDADAEARARSVRPDDPADLMFTSGTTGRPKGVLCSHAQDLRVFEVWASTVGLRIGDRYLLVNPMSHSFGYKAGILACLLAGATMLPLPAFDVDAVVDLVARERATVLPGPPTLYQAMLHHPRRADADLSSLRLAVTGAAAVPTSLVERMRADLGFTTVVTAYGLTESTGMVTICRPDDDAETIATTSGRAIPGVEVRVVDDAGREVRRGEPGEIVCRGHNVMQGYFEDPEATAEAIDADGWLHTGDIGTMDERGYVRITDRKKDMFIVGGFNAYPAEIEDLLLSHPDIAQVAVVGVPDERLGEVGVAYVVPAPGTDPSPDDIMAWARATMANYKVPRRVVVVDALPLNASGKVLKYELRQRATAGATT